MKAFLKHSVLLCLSVMSFFTSCKDEVVFQPNPYLPTVITEGASRITGTTARVTGEVTDQGRDSVVSKGVCYGTSPAPTLAGTFVASGSDIGRFSADLTGLAVGTTYYARAYATNGNGTAYGNEISFVGGGTGLPELTTTAASAVTTSSAKTGGNVTFNGGTAVIARGVCWSTSPAPTIDDDFTVDGSGVGTFISNVTGLSADTIYYLRAYATNTTGTAYGNEISFFTSGGKCGGMVTLLYNGYTYDIVEIGTQCWFKENLRSKQYRNGSDIFYPTTNTSWSTNTSGAYAYYNDNSINADTYGLLYNWYARQNTLCPVGWHLPSSADWNTLMTFLGGDIFAGGEMKTTTGWNAPNMGATNSSGFSALPAGKRLFNGTYGGLNQSASFWSSTDDDATNAIAAHLYHDDAVLEVIPSNKQAGYSCRCVKD